MKSVLIISTNTRIEDRLRSYLTEQGLANDYKIDSTASFGQGEAWWVSEGPDLLVILMPDDLVLQSFFIQKMLKDLPRILPVIFVASEVSVSFMHLSSAFKKMRALKAPISSDVLFKNISELLLERHPKNQQRHQRYAVEISAKLKLDDGSSLEYEVEVKNLSLGGAFLTFVGDPESFPEVGKMVKIEIASSGEEKQHSFTAEVVWHKDGEGIGVKFLNNDKSSS